MRTNYYNSSFGVATTFQACQGPCDRHSHEHEHGTAICQNRRKQPCAAGACGRCVCAGCTCGVYTLRCRMIIMMSSCSTKFIKYTVCQYITQFTDSILMSGQLCTFYLDRVYCLERAPSRTSTVRVTCLLTHTHKRTHSFHDILNCGLKKVGSWRTAVR